MNRPLQTTHECDRVPVTNFSLAAQARDPQPGGAANFVGVLVKIGPAVWNTKDGRRPTQAEVNAGLPQAWGPPEPRPSPPAIGGVYGLRATPHARGEPEIYTRLGFSIEKLYWSRPDFNPNRLYVDAGRIGNDIVGESDCYTDTPQVGQRYFVAVDELFVQAGPVQGELLGDLNAVHDGMVDLLRASPQPLP